MSTFPVTSVTLIAKIKNLAPGEDSAAWVRFWDTYQGAIRTFAALKGGEENADDIVMQVLGKLVDVLQSAVNHVLMHTALSDRDRQVYRAYALEGEDIADVAKKFGISRNFVSQIKTRIDKRIVAAGREMIAKEGL